MNLTRSLLARAKVVATSVVTIAATLTTAAYFLVDMLNEQVLVEVLPPSVTDEISGWLLKGTVVLGGLILLIQRVTGVIDSALGLFPPDDTTPADWVGEAHPTN